MNNQITQGPQILIMQFMSDCHLSAVCLHTERSKLAILPKIPPIQSLRQPLHLQNLVFFSYFDSMLF